MPLTDQQVDHQVMAVASAAYKRRDARERAAQHQQSLDELQRESLQLRERILELRGQGKTLQR